MNWIWKTAVSAALLCGSLCADETDFKLDKAGDRKVSKTIKRTGDQKDVMEKLGN